MFSEWADATRGYLSGWKWRSARRRGIRVFRYHGVVESKSDPVLDRNQHVLSVFRAQMDYLRRFRVIGVDELVEELARPRPNGDPAAMVTFDDGFQNNLLAGEVLSKRRIPWCVFVPSGEVGPRRAMWSVEVSLLLMKGRAETVTILERPWPLRTRQDRERTFAEVRGLLKSVPAPKRIEAVATLREQFPAGESDRLLDEHPWLRMLTWEELSELARAGVEIGSHGHHHEIQHEDQPEAVRREELVRSRTEIGDRLGRPCRAFAYPNGNFVATSPEEVERARYSLAFTTETGTVDERARSRPHLLPRLCANASLHGFVRAFWWEGVGAAVGAGSRSPRPSEA